MTTDKYPFGIPKRVLQETAKKAEKAKQDANRSVFEKTPFSLPVRK